MKRSNKLLILLGVLIVACVITVLVTRIQEHREEIKASGEVVLSIPTDSVTAISWSYQEKTLAFHKDGIWYYDADAAFPVDETKLNALLREFDGFAAAFVIEKVEDYGQYGLDEPIGSIQVTTEDRTVEMLLGDYSKLDSERYVSVGDGNVYLAKSDPLDSFDAVLSDLIQNDEIPLMDTVTEIAFSGAEDYTLTRTDDDASLSPCAEDVYFTEIGGKTLALDSYEVETWLSAVKGLSLTDYVTYNATEEELSSFGLDVPEMTATLAYLPADADETDQPETLTLSVGRNREELAAALENEEGDTGSVTAYVRIGSSPIVYRITQYKYSSLMSMTHDELRHQELFTADFDQVYQLDFTLEGETYSFTSELGEDGERVWLFAEKKIDISSLSRTLKALTADRFVNASPDQKEEIDVAVYLDNEYFPVLSMTIFRYDGTDCLAQYGGETVALVPRSQTVALVEAVNAIVLRSADD